MLKNKPTSFIRSYLVSIKLWNLRFFDTFLLLTSKYVKWIKPAVFEKGFIELRSNPLQATPGHSNPLQVTPGHSNPLQPTPGYSNLLQPTPGHPRLLQSTPGHSNPLQVTPTNSNPLQSTPTNSIHFNPLHAALTHCKPLHLLQTTLETQPHAIRNHSWLPNTLQRIFEFCLFIFIFQRVNQSSESLSRKNSINFY